jgi:hypothetical protein
MADQTAKKARAKKELSKERQAAMKAMKDASSDQEKTLAKQKLHLVRFKEVASIRADAAIRALKNLEKVCDTTSYAWTQDQAEKILSAILPTVTRITDGLKKPGAKTAKREKFTL